MELDIKSTTELGWAELGWATAHKQSPFLPMGQWEEQLKKEQNKHGLNMKNGFFLKIKIKINK